ncbi:MAG: hypothetical protein D6786_02960 [Gammaproteobacteria bacterium]|nr:MAG: hypothetical protein D6786_02960 [Gammaproteobacteria bacterium]
MNRFGKLLLPLLLLLCVGVPAEDGPLLSEKTYKALNEVHELLGKEQYRQAISRLQSLLAKVEGNRYESAVVLQTLGYAYSGAGKYKEAAGAFDRSLALNALPEGVAHGLRYNAAQLHIYSGEYRKGLKHLTRWFRDEAKPPVESLVLAATAHYQLKQYKSASRYLQRAIRASRHPREGWYQMLLACRLQLKQYKSALKVVRTMVRRYPSRREYWTQLVALYQRNRQEGKALATLELMRTGGMLDSDERLRLARMYLYLDLPWLAGRHLRQSLASAALPATHENWFLLAQSWLQAREKPLAVEALEKAVEAGPPDGSTHALLGQLLVDLERWREAVPVLAEALRRGGLKHPALTRFLYGLALYHSGDPDQAVRELRLASNDKSLHDQAQWWLQYISDRRANAISEPGETEQKG